MIDFEEAGFYAKLKQVENNSYDALIGDFLVEKETILSCYKTKKDGVIFTDKRIITINCQGAFGKKKDFTSIPYSKITTFALEVTMLELFVTSAGLVTFEFSSMEDGKEAYKTVSTYTLV